MDVIKVCIGLGMGILLSGCAATYESAENSYQQGDISEARTDWESLAKEGDVKSMYRLYTSARLASPSDIKWLQKAADSNLTEAQYDYGMWLHGEENYQASKDYLEKASANSSQKAKSFLSKNEKIFPLWLRVEKGNPYFNKMLGDLYWEKKEYRKSLKWYERCVDFDKYCSFYLGLAYANGYGVSEDYKKAFDWYLLSAKEGNLDSARNLAWQYEDGQGTEVNKSEAFKWMNFANKNGFERSTVALGRYYAYGIGTEKNTDKAKELLAKYANKNKNATYHLALLSYLEKDYKKSYDLFSKKLLSDDATSIYYLAQHHYHGQGRNKNLTEALKLFKVAAEKGVSYAEYQLALMYKEGEGTTRNDRKAFYWYTQAAEKGHPSAQNNLAVMYGTGTATEKNEYKALSLYKKSAEQGLAIAQKNLANYYEYGHGTSKNYQNAVYWYAKAAQQNYQGAQKSLNSILNRVSKKYINVSESSLYAKQDFDSQAVKKVDRGDTVYIISSSRDWSQVYFPENNSLGYVHNSHLR